MVGAAGGSSHTSRVELLSGFWLEWRWLAGLLALLLPLWLWLLRLLLPLRVLRCCAGSALLLAAPWNTKTNFLAWWGPSNTSGPIVDVQCAAVRSHFGRDSLGRFVGFPQIALESAASPSSISFDDFDVVIDVVQRSSAPNPQRV